MISLWDNRKYNRDKYGDLSPDVRDVLQSYSGIGLDELAHDYPGLLVFPNSLGVYGDNWENECLYLFRGNELWAGNVVGFFGIKGIQVQIRSRFDQKDGRQYLFHYMLGRVLGINMLKWEATTDKESVWDFLPFLFPCILKRAIQQGLFRAYMTFSYNDDHIRGAIDVARHIRHNIPFNGQVAYRTREHTVNNFLISLVRHTIEYIKRSSRFSSVLENNTETREAVRIVIECTPDYSHNDLRKVVAQNLRPVKHPFYTEYTSLQKLCLQIIHREKMTFGNDKDKVNGIVFKAEWLWEEYLNTILCQLDFIHPQPSKPRTGLPFYEPKPKEYHGAFPDFYSEKKGIVMDAKYKKLDSQLFSSELRDDRFQLISYVHITSANAGILLYPAKANTPSGWQREGTLRGYKLGNGHGGTIGVYGLQVPNSETFEAFSRDMQKQEIVLQDGIRNGIFADIGETSEEG